MGIRLIHIAPELPPTVGGVADYTAILSRRLVEVGDETIEPVFIHAGKKSADQIAVDYPVKDIGGTCTAQALMGSVKQLAGETNEPVVILLEYSGYGYSNRGAPLWLVRALRGVKRADDLPLITIFHELYAHSYKPWDRRFWTMPLQRHIATRLATISDGLMANWDAAAQWLEQWVNGKAVRVSPTFSNVGEPASVPHYSEREPYAVCFGGARRKEGLYRQHGNELSNVLRGYGIERIVDLGSEPAS